MGQCLTPGRRRELKSLSSPQLIGLVVLDRDNLSREEFRYIHDLAAKRLRRGDSAAEEVLLNVRLEP
jgi:hypothetical protein